MSIAFLRLWCLCCLCLTILGIGSTALALAADTLPAPTPGVAYSASLQGAPAEVMELLQSVSRTLSETSTPPASELLLERRVEDDHEVMLRALKSYGYFKATLDHDIALADANGGPARVTFRVEPGVRFRYVEAVARYAPEVAESPELPILPEAKEMAMAPGQPYRSADVLAARDALLVRLGDQGYPYPQVQTMRVVADHNHDHVRVEYTLSPGPRAVFGPTRVEGLERMDEDYVRSHLPWRQGEPFNAHALEQGRFALLQSGLYTVVEVQKAPQVADDGQLPITLSLRERAPRSFRAGLNYTTDFGLGGRVSWEHRNLFGRAESLSASLALDKDRQILDTAFRKPNFWRDDQVLNVPVRLMHENTEAYESRSGNISAVVQRKLTDQLSVGLGVGFRHAVVQEHGAGSERTFNLGYVPLTMALDTRNDVLNPSRGWVLTGQVTPYKDLVNPQVDFLRYRISGSTYWSFDDLDRYVLALRGAFAQILGATRSEVPPDLREYAGGGGSLRGFGYQMAGPVRGKQPLGGLSLVEASVEMRIRINDAWGVVPFVDFGRAYAKLVPDPTEQLFIGAGLGLRYYTGFGPIRVDVALPLNGRSGTDLPVQFYVSIGQAF